MKTLRFFLVFILSITYLTLFHTPIAARANETQVYATAKYEDAYFFAKPDNLSALFILPFTYCVEVLGERGEYYYVKYADDVGNYQAVYGYCLKEQVQLLDDKPKTTFLQMSIPVTFKQEVENTTLPVLNQITIDACFYGEYISGGAEYSYVLFNGQFGYVSGSVNYPLNDLDQTKDAVAETTQTSTSTKIITAIYLTALSAVALILLFLTGKNQRKPKHNRPYVN